MTTSSLSSLRLGGLVLLVALVPACRSVYYKTREGVTGAEKRQILVERVQRVRETQQKATDQFRDTFEQLEQLVGAPESDLHERYDKLKKALESSREREEEARDKAEGMEQVGRDLFREWKKELGRYEDVNLRRESEQSRDETQARYDRLVAVVRGATQQMDPVLRRFEDQVLFLKHDLTPAAVSHLRDSSVELRADLRQLIAGVDAAIAEADSFIAAMGPSGQG
jgi:Skp family chaperone for outer membrane proteins